MSSLIKRKSSMVLPELHEYQCSGCSHKLETTRETIEFCWHCGSKFGPEPKNGPTEGDWYYDKNTARLFSRSVGGVKLADLEGPTIGIDWDVVHCNGYLMAESKKLLAACHKALSTGIPNFDAALQVSQAIAEAEKGKQ